MSKQNFLNPEQLLIEAGLASGMQVADLGAGNGFFTIPASRIVGDQGMVWSVDILEESLGRVASSARLTRRKNVRTLRCDLDAVGGCSILELSCDFVIIGKVIPQLRHPDRIIREAWRLLRTGGIVLVIEWKKGNAGFGPPQQERLSSEEVQTYFIKQGFKFLGSLETDPYHVALKFQK